MMQVIWLNIMEQVIWLKKRKQSFEFYLTASGTDNDSQMRALLLHFIYLEDVGTTYKAEMDALNNHVRPKKNVAFERYVFR